MMGRQEDGRRYRGAPYRGSSGMFVYPPIKFVDNHKKQKTNHSIWKGMKMGSALVTGRPLPLPPDT